MSKSVLVTSAHLICYINGQRFGRVTGFKFSSETPRDADYGLDCAEPFELSPTISKVVGTLEVLRVQGDGGLEGAGIVARLPDIPKERYFSLMLVDRATDLVYFRADRCSVTGQQWSAPARGRVSGAFNFEAIDWSNEVKPLH